MDTAQRSEMLRRRFKTLGRHPASVAQAAPARGLVGAKLPPRPVPRQGVTGPVTGPPAYSSLGPTFAEPMRLKWMETEPHPQNNFKRLEPSRKKCVSPLVLIAEQWPKRVARLGA